MRFSFLCTVALALGPLGGCGGEGDNPWPPLGGGGASGTSGNGGRPNNGGSSGAAERGGAGNASEDLTELRALEACEVPEPCESRSYVQLIEQRTHNIQKAPVSCVLTGLAERRPGRYVHRTEAVFSNGSTEAVHVIVVGADGSAAYVRDPSQSLSGSDGLAETVIAPDPAQRCTLKSASYFEACVAEVQAATSSDDDAAWACVFGDGTSLRASRLDWFESCEREAPPRCESGTGPVDEGDAGVTDAAVTDAGAEGDASADAAP